jgi:hypothetical protein
MRTSYLYTAYCARIIQRAAEFVWRRHVSRIRMWPCSRKVGGRAAQHSRQVGLLLVHSDDILNLLQKITYQMLFTTTQWSNKKIRKLDRKVPKLRNFKHGSGLQSLALLYVINYYRLSITTKSACFVTQVFRK